MKKRLLALLTVLCMLLSMLPATAFAKTVEPLEPVYISQYNPLYGEPDEGITLEQYAPVTLADHTFEGQNYPDDREQVVATLRAGLEARQNTITFNYFLDGDTYDGSEAAGKAMLSGLFASALEHTGEPTEGDYIHWVYEKMGAGSNGYVYGGDYYLTITFTMTYYTTAAQEQAVTDRLATVMPSFGFTAETDDYTKVKTIYDYICDNVVYDNANLKDDSYKLKYTAYAALINGTSVCQGYAVLLYRMLLMAGVDNRVITGISNGGNHAWNIVQLGEYYYDADSTWDAGETEYDYFLRCPANFDPTHTRHDEYNTAAFNTAYPMADADYGSGILSGQCGANAYWTLYPSGLLEITGSGAMYDYTASNAPWKSHLSNITYVNVGDNITAIGTYAFYGCSAMTKLTVGKKVSDIGANAFTGCTALNTVCISDLTAWMNIAYDDATAYPLSCNTLDKDLYLNGAKVTALEIPDGTLTVPYKAFMTTTVTSVTVPNSVTAIDGEAFSNCSKLTSVTLGSGVKTIGALAFYKTTALRTLVLPSSVTELGMRVFWNSGIKTLTFTGKAPAIGDYCFSGVTATAYYPCNDTTWTASVRTGYDGTVTWKANHSEKVIPGTPNSCFSGGYTDSVKCSVCGETLVAREWLPAQHHFTDGYCTVCSMPEGLVYTTSGGYLTITDYTGSLSELTIPATLNNKRVNAIQNTAFEDCTSLVKVTLPDTISTIDFSAFSGCTNLQQINIPASVREIKSMTFYNCRSLTSIVIPENITKIAWSAFENCTALSSVTLPSTITEIGNSAFDGCTASKKVYLSDIASFINSTADDYFSSPFSCSKGNELYLNGTLVTDLTLPGEVTTIGVRTFYGCDSLTSITISEGTTNIEEAAFQFCNNVTSITLPKSIEYIGNFAFNATRPGISIYLADLASYINSTAQTSSSATPFSSSTDNKLYLNGALITDLVIPDGVTTVGVSAFAGCDFNSVTIPASVTTIKENAFNRCTVSGSITFTGDILTVKAGAFSSTTATALYPCDNDTWTDTAVADLAAAHTSVTWTAAHDPKTVSGTANSCFTGGLSDGVQCTICEKWLTPQTPILAGHKNENGYCTVCGLPEGLTYTVYHTVTGDTVTVTGYTGSLTELTVPATIEGKPVTALDGGGAFQYNTTLKKVTLPDTLTAFGGYTFNGCSALESVNIPAGVKSIGGYSFANCTALKSITIPEGVTEIGVHAFYQSGLTSITVPNSVTSLLGGAFSYCKSLTDVTLGSGLTTLPLSLFSGCSALKTLTIPANVTTIGDEAFQFCTALECITIPNKVTDIGDRAFYNCTALEKITFTGDLPIIGTSCFASTTATAYYPCDNDTWTDTMVTGLASAHTSVTWKADHDPKTVFGTPNSCFTGGISDGVQCTICEEWLTPQTPVPAGHKLIVDGYCTVCGLPQGLTYTVSGDSVTVTGYAGSLTELTIPETINGKTVTAIDDYAFDGCVRLTRITLPDSITTIGKFAFMSCSALENVNIPASVNAIRNGTFSGCASLKTVSLPSHIGSIGDYAFDGCTGLERITLPNSVTSIGMYAFESCTALERITIPEGVIDIGKHAFVYCSHLAEVRFLGNAPIFGPNCFSGVTADAYYPCGDTWTENKLQSYGGSISWTVEHNYVGGVCTGCGAAEPSVDGVYRLAGSNRFDTAFKSADALKEVMGVDKFPAAIVTSGMNFADALAGSYLAARTGAPILLTDNDNMADVIAYILENVEEGGTVYALGGSSIVSDTLRAVTNSGYTFKRLAGASRFETNLMILEEAGIDSGDPVLVCTAYNFADSLSASALGMPILLVDDTVSAAQMAFLEENADGEFVLVGGTGAVKPAVEQQLREKWDVVRLAGASRFDTSVLTAIESFGSTGVDYAVLAYGYNFPDGLCAGPLAYALGAPLILTANGDEAAAVEYATAAGITDGFVLGGPSLIDDTVTRAIFSMTAGDSIQR